MKQEKDYTAYRVDFSYVIVQEASMYVIAASIEDAREGGRQMLEKTAAAYQDAEITNVQEHTPPADDDVDGNVTIN